MKTSQILKLAKVHLSDGAGNGSQQFICWAIGKVYGVPEHALMNLKQDITHKLGYDYEGENYTSTLELWLSKNHNIPMVKPVYNGNEWVNKAEVAAYQAKLQRTRHAWIDSMIAEFEAQGD
jgi:hypothetical protein